MADAPKAHESLSTEARRVPVQGTPIPLISVFIAIFRLGTIWRYSHPLLYANKSELGTSIIPSGCCRINLLQFQQHLHCLQWFLLQICCFSIYNWQILPLVIHNLTICIYCQHKTILFQYMIHLSNIAI